GERRPAGAARHPRLHQRRRRSRYRGRPGVRSRAVRPGVLHRRHARRHRGLPRQAQADLPRTLTPPAMHRKPDATGPAIPAAPDAARLVMLLRDDDLDAALDAGLMAFIDDGAQALDDAARTLLVETQRPLRAA